MEQWQGKTEESRINGQMNVAQGTSQCFVQALKSCRADTPAVPHLQVRRTPIACLCSFFIQKNTGHDALSPCNYSKVVLNHSSHVPHEYLGRCMHQRLCVQMVQHKLYIPPFFVSLSLRLFFPLCRFTYLVLSSTFFPCVCSSHFPYLNAYSTVTSFAPHYMTSYPEHRQHNFYFYYFTSSVYYLFIFLVSLIFFCLVWSTVELLYF